MSFGSPEFYQDLFLSNQESVPFMDDIGTFSDITHDVFPDTSEESAIKLEFGANPLEKYGPPPRGDFKGYYNFEVSLNSSTADRKKCMYSKNLDRVYLCMMSEMAVHFQWDWEQLENRQMWVRATPILSSSAQQEARVTRCHNHRVRNDNSNRDVPDFVVPHIMRSVRQDLTSVRYCGADNNENTWLSVAVAMPSRPPSGVQDHQHVYRFCCKHSCTSGINRRRIEVLFTLEDSIGEVLGRKSLGVRVCSCPRRDMDKEEAEFRELQNDGPPKKKQKVAMQPKHLPSLSHQPLSNTPSNPTVKVLVDSFTAHCAMKRLLIPNLKPNSPVCLAAEKYLHELQLLEIKPSDESSS